MSAWQVKTRSVKYFSKITHNVAAEYLESEIESVGVNLSIKVLGQDKCFGLVSPLFASIHFVYFNCLYDAHCSKNIYIFMFCSAS